MQDRDREGMGHIEGTARSGDGGEGVPRREPAVGQPGEVSGGIRGRIVDGMGCI